MNATAEGNPPRRARARWVVAAVFLVFFLPVVVAIWLNVTKPGWLPLARANHGEIVEPPRTISVAGLDALGAGGAPALTLERRWTLLLLAGNGCDERCERRVSDLARVRVGLGRHAGRVQRLVVIGRQASPGMLPGEAAAQPDLRVAAGDEAWVAAVHGDAGRATADLYLVDPRGYLVLRYAPEVDPRDVQSDLERLLKISRDERE